MSGGDGKTTPALSDSEQDLEVAEGDISAIGQPLDITEPPHVSETTEENEQDHSIEAASVGDLDAQSETEMHDSEGPQSEEARLREQLAQARQVRDSAQNSVNALRREQKRLMLRRERIQESLESIELERDQYEEASQGLNSWIRERSSSFAWKLLERLRRERSLLDAEMQKLKERIEQPIAIEAESGSALQDRFMKRVFLSIALVGAVYAVVSALKYQVPALSLWESWLNPFFWPSWVLALVMLAVFLGVWVLLLISYYRDTSKRRQKLAIAQETVNYYATAAAHLRQERSRLETLHSQVPQYLEYLSEVLHRPWEAPVLTKLSHTQGAEEFGSLGASPEAIVFDSQRPDPAYLPTFMRLAEVPELSGDPNEQALVRDAVRKLVRPGWRSDALDRLLSKVEEAQALPPQSLAPARLDRDYRLRETVMKALESPHPRQEAGREALRTIARLIQVAVMDEVHPPVKDIAPDPLDGLTFDTDLLNDSDARLVAWDAFLSQNLGEAGEWTPEMLSIAGRQAGMPDMESEAYGPERLAGKVHGLVNFTGIAERSARPIELTLRIDRTVSVLEPTHLNVFEGVPTSQDADPGQEQGYGPSKDYLAPDAEPDHL